MRVYAADFETTTKPEDCRVWAYAICEVGNTENCVIGTNIDDFMSWCRKQKDNPKVFFHNLKFDAQFLIAWLLKNGFKHVTKSRERAANTFTTTISDKGMFYTVEVIFRLHNRNIRKVTFQDSLKLVPLSVKAIAQTFNLPIQKGSIDYKAHDDLPPDSPLTEEEKDYLIRDVQIVAHALDFFFKQGLDKMTIGACALDEYKRLVTKRKFERYYPTPEYHTDVKQSYRGGFTYLNPKFAGKTIKNGVVLDVNSLYPSVMRYEYLPYGTPIFFKGKYEPDALYPLYVQMIKVVFDIKPGKIPTIQIKNSMFFTGNEYLTTTDDEEVTICLTSVDLELFFEQYNVKYIEYLSGWKFKCSKGLFDTYIDKWSAQKIKAKEENNPGMYMISKLYLNNLYGKFGTDTTIRSKTPYLSEGGIVKYKDSEPETRKGIYIAVATFITSYAREKTIRAAQTITDNYNAGKSKIQFVYADTDSLHCVSPDFELPEGLDIDSTKLGAWDFEASFKRGKFLRQKCYIEEHIITEKEYEKGLKGDHPYLYSKAGEEFTKLKITVAGMPADCYKYVSFKNFNIGQSYEGKKSHKVVPGGMVLEHVDFTIKRV